MEKINDHLLSWASIMDDQTRSQAEALSKLSVIEGHVALMPDAHWGKGAAVGSVIPTKGAILPAAVGVDLGCGMIAVELDLKAEELPDNLRPTLDALVKAVPCGVGLRHEVVSAGAYSFFNSHPPASELSDDLRERALAQFGTLGAGNHFIEVCLDERDHVWVVLHSGSRGIGNILATGHIKLAGTMIDSLPERIEDPNLAYFIEGTPEFKAYIADMLWAQDYAAANREAMLDAILLGLLNVFPRVQQVSRTNCHHNYTTREVHNGSELWITRKGAISAAPGVLGIIPGSMGTRSYIVSGLGNELSWNSCSHGAGRVYGRKAAERIFTAEDMNREMEGKMWLSEHATELLDEIPSAYKDIDQVMADQADLVSVVHTLHQVVNVKGL
jgi:tRNA-splicing ligase RtcB